MDKKVEISKEERPLMVTIRCITYNHEPYIRQCLEGFIMQKTNFRFEAIVHDDASTDGTADIIREYAEKYPDIIKPIFETENQYSKRDGSLARIMDEHTHGKYVAMCEGDDYWIDPLKLQKQVDFLEKHHDYSLVYSKIKCYSQSENRVKAIFGKERKNLKDRLMKECFIGTCTSCFRTCDYFDYIHEIQPNKHDWLMGDVPLFLYLGTKGFGKMFNECMGVYRILQSSASHSDDVDLQLKRIRNTIDIYTFFANRYYPDNNRIKNKLLGGYLYRVYMLFKGKNRPLPDNYKQDICSYTGTHFKLHVVRIVLLCPFFSKLLDFLIKFRMSLIIRLYK